MTSELFVQSFAAFIPENETDVPPLSYLPSLFKRRLSQITKMTIQAVHDVLDATPGLDKAHTKMVFASYRGELSYAFKVNNQYAEDYTIMPATFSLSVHNAAIAEATIAFRLTGGYTTVYPEQEDFYAALQAAAAPVLSGDEKQVLFVYADEHIPEPYKNVAISGATSEGKAPFAFAAVLSATSGKALSISDFTQKGSRDFMAAYR